MQLLTHRDYRGDDDHEEVVKLWLAVRAAGCGDPWPPLDAIQTELVAHAGGSKHIQVWADRLGRPVAAAMLLDGCILVWCAKAGSDDEELEAAVVAWGRARTDTMRRSGERPALFVSVYGHDERLIALLRRAGFREDPWRTLRLTRSLYLPIATPRICPGVSIRPVASKRDSAGVAELHHALFAGGQKSADERAAMLRAPGYHPALDLIAVLDHGPAVGYAFGTCCVLECERLAQARGWVEFVGVAQAQRGRGIGRALTLHLLYAMRAAGLDTALLTTSAVNLTARHLFEACGFVVRQEVRWYVHEGA